MTSEIDSQEILKRLQALEEENARLRKAANLKETKPLKVSEGEYKGHPTLVFEGPCKPFALGLKKLGILRQAWPQVENFLDRHSKTEFVQSLADYDDDKI
jgi:hypothetical protein